MKARKLTMILVMVAIAIVAFVHYCMEQVPFTTHESWSDAALENPFLAASQFMSRQGVSVSNQPTYTGVPDGSGALLMEYPDSTLTPEQAHALTEWVAAGNQVLLSIPPTESETNAANNPMTGDLGVSVALLPRFTNSPVGNSQCPSNWPDDKPGKSDQAPADVGDPSIWVALGNGQLLTTTLPLLEALKDNRQTAVMQVCSRLGPVALVYAVGHGHITVVSDLGIFCGKEIGLADNAALLQYLALQYQPRHLWIVYSGHFPPLHKLIWQNARESTLALLLFAIGWVWFQGRRFGPLLPVQMPARRQLAAHLYASGRYLWYAGQQPRLYKALRGYLRNWLFLRHPEWRFLSNNDLVTVLAERTGLDPAAIRSALISNPRDDLAQYLADARVLHYIRNKL